MPAIFGRTTFGIALAAVCLGVADAGSSASPRGEAVTIRVLGSAHDRGEIKPCG